MAKSATTVPAFLNKLWKMVNDPATDHLICWSPKGNGFIIQNQAQFWYELLPLHYKHNNMSSFVRQLNMYGFHKRNAVDNGSMDSEKDEIQFFHPFFQKEHPELLQNIKRKVTGNKLLTNDGTVNILPEDWSKVLSDVKQIRGQQVSVDSQLSAMKQENTVLWRELAILRQKHMKQQQIVNKLIQFLVTMVQPSHMSGLGGKRPYPLMLHENPMKRAKTKETTTSCGPIIHELDTEIASSDVLLSKSREPSPTIQLPQQQNIGIKDEEITNTEYNRELVSELPENLLNEDTSLTNKQVKSFLVNDLFAPNSGIVPEDLTEIEAEAEYVPLDTLYGSKVFLNQSSPDAMLSDLVTENGDPKNSKSQENAEASNNNEGNQKMALATRDNNLPFSRINSIEDLELHLENNQNELDQLKDLLNYSLDGNTVFGRTSSSTFKLFNNEDLPYGLTLNQGNDSKPSQGSELTTYDSGLMDFSQLFDDNTSDPLEGTNATLLDTEINQSINTPQVEEKQPVFPAITSKKSKK